MTTFPARAASGSPANLRDLAGTRTDDGYRLRSGVLYRSDAAQPGGPRTGLPAGSAWPPATVVVLRPGSAPPRSHPLAEAADVRTVLLSGPERDAADPGGAGASVTDVELAQVMRIVAGSPGPVLVHGTAGPDRTGVVVGVLLATLGVPRATIVEHHLAATGRTGSRWARLRLRRRTGPPADAAGALEALLDDLEAHEDGVAGRLRDADVTDGDLRRLAERLLEPDLPA